MSRLEDRFARRRATGQAALIPYIMAGDPSLEATERLVPALEAAGADIIELGVPFSDPLADGPVIQQAGQRALAQKTSLRSVLELVARLRRKTAVPLVLMTYYNLIHRYGEAAFARDAAQAGVDGIILPDLPPEEAGTLAPAAREAGLDLIRFVAPTSPPARIKTVCRGASGFVYYVSLTGITGAGLKDLEEVRPRVAAIRRFTKLPVAVGFGVSTPEQAAAIARIADGVIVGTALVRVIAQNPGEKLIPAATAFVSSLRRAVDGRAGTHSG